LIDIANMPTKIMRMPSVALFCEVPVIGVPYHVT
jgi:hypothetical protein